MKNKKGWIRVIEAFLAAMIILVVLILAINQQSAKQQSSSSVIVYNAEVSILQNIEMNNSLRGEIIGIGDSALPLNSDNQSFPPDLKNAIDSLVSEYYPFLSCGAQICGIETDSECNYWKKSSGELYSQNSLITANITDYNPRKISLFCTTGQ